MSRKAKKASPAPEAGALDARLESVFKLYDSSAYAAVLQAAAEFVKETRAPSGSLEAQALAVVAWSAYRLGRYNEAQDICDRLAKASQDTSSIKRLEIVLSAQAGEHKRCCKLWQAHVKQVKHWQDLKSAIGQLLYECRDVTVAAADAEYQLRSFDESARILEKACATRPEMAEFYLELARVRKRTNDETGQRRTLTLGLAHALEKRDLAKLSRGLIGPERLSVCMIVKNEEKFLPQCLASIHGFADEIVVVDTGSTDRTVEIAESFGAKVYHHPWENNFSLHRNQSLNYATGEWVFIIDADEEFIAADLEKLKLAMTTPDVNILSISVHNKHTRTGEFTSFLPSVRLWRRKLNLHYEGIVHNELRLPPQEPILRVDAKLIHYGYGLDWNQMKQKIARSKELLHEQLRGNPNNAFANFNLAQLLRGEHQLPPEDVCREILDHAGRAVANTNPQDPAQRHIHLMALDQMCSAHFYLKDYAAAEQAAKTALKHDPNYLDPLFALGHIYAAQRRFPEAIAAYSEYIKAADAYDPGRETTNYILIHSADQAAAYFSLGLIHEELDRIAEAEHYFRKILEIKPDHLDVLTHLALLRYKQSDYNEAAVLADQRLASEPKDLSARYIMARVAQQRGDARQALDQVDSILAHDPQHVKALELRVSLLRELGEDENARTAAGRVNEVDPNNYTAQIQLAELHSSRGEHCEAAAVYLRLTELHPNDSELFNNLGNCHFRLQNFAEAIRYYSTALSIHPQLVPALRNIGLAYFKSSDPAAAIRHLSNYLDHAPDDLEVTYLTARLNFDLGRYQEAIRHTERALVKHPHSAELLSFLADNYLKLGHVESASLGYRKAIECDPSYSPALAMLSEIDRFQRAAASQQKK